jgi:hypothetical protein
MRRREFVLTGSRSVASLFDNIFDDQSSSIVADAAGSVPQEKPSDGRRSSAQ